MGEIDQLVHALRGNGLAEQEHGTEELSPGLAALDRLIEPTRAAGLNLTVNIRGEHGVLSPRVDQAAYRILQEALTNAVRHGEGSAEMKVTLKAQVVELTVTNPPIGCPAAVGTESSAFGSAPLCSVAVWRPPAVTGTFASQPSFPTALGGRERAVDSCAARR